eukprot:CAMPEP_0201571000 /NCGR_PEP_ID=MMETSP0190_2-20130828/13540_1 /ASSEMBLY_ACC=CAM_ASM_000263 /TAXON_ID=37353 /ORGANISM="Rosalina sp." /LENGTH=330 /DNA_ID=CAMNT_0047995193 /DNA_START=214 /DNA_END=1203 /DNA_ORIENTATION=-
MGEMITCYEQNDESYIGYKDKIYSPEADKETGEVSEMCLNEDTVIWCDRYVDEAYINAGRGDVCDHTDPTTYIRRNACYFNTIFGAEVNDEKTWSYKCWEISQCPLKDANGDGRIGCQVTRQRITCCCQDEDYCNGDDLIEIFATYGKPENYPPDYQELCDIDFSQYDWYVAFKIDATGWTDQQNYECSYDPEGIDFTGNYDTDTIADDITDDTDGQGTYDLNDNDEDQTTDGKCLIIGRTENKCSCGGDCYSYEYEYTATTERCGDAELVTGEFGAETCDPENPVYEIGEEVCCEVLDCANGEFRITSDGYMNRNGIYINIMAIFCILW